MKPPIRTTSVTSFSPSAVTISVFQRATRPVSVISRRSSNASCSNSGIVGNTLLLASLVKNSSRPRYCALVSEL